MNKFPKHINTYLGGMDKDTAPDKYDNTHYLNAENLRILTEEGLTSGALKTVKGTDSKWYIPEHFAYAGHTFIRDKIVLFARGDRSAAVYETDYIYYFDPTDVLGTLSASERVYSGDLSISEDTIIDAVGRYETEDIQKVYFTDGTNSLRFCNLLDSNLSSADPEYLNIFPTFIQDAIDVDSTNNPIQGGNLTSGVIQYTYILYSINGAETTFASLSLPTVLAEGSASDSYLNIKGADSGTNVNKSVQVTITNPDSDIFTRARLIAIHYEDPYLDPTIRIVGEYRINISLDILDNGSSIGSYTAEEFNSLKNLFACQHLETKNNYLFAANIKENYIDLPTSTYDTRAYRFNSTSNSAVIEKSDGTQLTIDSTAIANDSTNWGVSDTHDCICPYNDGFDALSSTIYNLQYNSGSPSTLGGEGPNIKYSFTSYNMDLSVIHDTSHTKSYGSNFTIDTGTVSPTNYLYKKLGNEGYQYNSYFSDNITFQRDEIYRFAIVFIDDKGRQTFPKWIADIRMPNYTDLDFYTASVSSMVGTGFNIQFTVNITQELIDLGISGFKIVRVERDVLNSTVLDTGYMGSLKPHDSLSGYMFPSDLCIYQNGEEIIPGTTTATAHIETPILSDTYKEYITPELNYNKSNFLKTDGYFHSAYRFEYGGTLGHDPDGSSSATINQSAFIIKKYVTTTAISQQKFSINNSVIFSDQSYNASNSADAFNTSLGSTTVWNHSEGARSVNDNDQARGTCLVVDGTAADTPSSVFDSDYAVEKGALYVLRRRDVIPYGGNTFSDRANTQYIECSDYSDISSLTAGQTKQSSGYGDTTIGIFEHIRTFISSDTDALDSRNLEVLYLPVETRINLGLDQGLRFYSTLIEDGSNEALLGIKETVGVHAYSTTDFYTQIKPLYDYNLVYSRPQNLKIYNSEPLDFDSTSVDESDIKVIASEKKINGELNDSWTVFKFNNEIEVDGSFGKITDLINHKNKLVCFQSKGICVLSVNDREMVTTQDGSSLALGSGGILTRFDYLSTRNGTEYKQSVVSVPEGLIWYDNNSKGVYTIKNLFEPSLSKVKGMSSWFRETSISDVKTGYDRDFNEILFNIQTGASTNEVLVFNTLTQSFVGFYSLPLTDFIYNNNYLYGIYYNTSVSRYNAHLHNQDTFTLYNEDYTSKLDIIVNPESPLVCRFDTVQWITEVENYVGTKSSTITFDKLKAYNSYQTSPWYEDSTYFTRRFRTWKHNTLRDDSTDKPRLRDYYLVLQFEYESTNNYALLVNDLITSYIPNKH